MKLRAVLYKRAYLKFQDSLVQGNVMVSDYFAEQNRFVPLLKKCDADIPICNESISRSIQRSQFLLKVSLACTIHKVQGLSFEEGVVNFDLQKQRTFGQGQMYTALSRVSCYDKHFRVVTIISQSESFCSARVETCPLR